MITQKKTIKKKVVVKKTYRDKHNPNVVIEEYDIPAEITWEDIQGKFEKVEV